MLLRCARRITSFFIDNELLQERLFDWYVYTLQRVILFFCGTLILFIVNSVFYGIIETLCLLQSLFWIRRRSGGFHIKTWWKCWILSLSISLIGSQTGLLLFQCNTPPLIVLSTIVSCLVICAIVPVNNTQMNLDVCALQVNAKKAKSAVAVEFIITFLLMWLFPNKPYSAFCSIAISIAAASILIEKVKSRRNQNETID